MIQDSTHPEYTYAYPSWEKFRFIKDGGDDFIDKYLTKYSDRETDPKFEDRAAMTPIPGFAAAAIIDIKNAIFQRMTDTTRLGGSDSFRKTVSGEQGGVDLKGANMNYFIGNDVLLELLFMGKVGVYVDMPELDPFSTLKDTTNKHPYYYTYRTEDIRNWRLSQVGDESTFDMLLLSERILTFDEFDLPAKDQARYRLLTRADGGVYVRFFSFEGKEVDIYGEVATEPIFLDIPKIPFVQFELNRSLLADIANHQIALLNLESSDISFALLSNVPHYIEQQSRMQSPHLKDASDSGGTETNSKEMDIGGMTGRSYGQGLDAPQFIHPSPEPLQASIAKQAQLKDDIRSLVQLALSAVQPKFASARSKEFDQHGLESGLSYIGLVLEHGEQQLAEIYANYETDTEIAKVTYPRRYSLKSDAERLEEAEKLQDIINTVPTKTGQKLISKLILEKLFAGKLTQEELDDLYKEVDEADYVTSDPETVLNDFEKGLVSTLTASKARGYDAETEVEQAKLDHAERIERIQEAQTSGEQSRGLPDLDSESDSGTVEKKISQEADVQETPSQATRN